MKRSALWILAAAALVLVAAVPRASAQATFKVTFPFVAGGAKLPSGEYSAAPKDDGHITLRQIATGKEFPVPFTKRLPQAAAAREEPQLVFDVVGNFAPSYTEYVTDYVLAEVWLPGAEGYLIHFMKGAHKTQVLKGQKDK